MMQLGRTGMGFTEKRLSKNAVFSMVLGGALLVIHCVMILLSILSGGDLPLAGGLVESYLLLFGIFGAFWAVLSYDEEKTVNRFKAIGIALNLVVIALSIVIMGIGFMTYDI